MTQFESPGGFSVLDQTILSVPDSYGMDECFVIVPSLQGHLSAVGEISNPKNVVGTIPQYVSKPPVRQIEPGESHWDSR